MKINVLAGLWILFFFEKAGLWILLQVDTQ
jgi:hypothetical protein